MGGPTQCSGGTELARIAARIKHCRQCPRLLAHCAEVARIKRRAYRRESYWGRPVPGFGDPRARLIVVGLAPAAHGANRTGRMFTGDRSGLWLYRALYSTGFANRPFSEHRRDGLHLRGAYVTAALHCAPPENKPTCAELACCRHYLVEELHVFLPRRPRCSRVLLALGAVAFTACLRAVKEMGTQIPRPRPRFAHAGEHRLSRCCTLLASYHPSQQNTLTGRLSQAMLESVFHRAREIIKGSP